MCENNINYIYLLREREFVKSDENIFKIGMSKQINNNRFNQYPKGSILLLQMICCDCKLIENKLLKIFKLKFKQRNDIGNETFEGNYKEMIDIIYLTIKEESNIVKDNEEFTNKKELLKNKDEDLKLKQKELKLKHKELELKELEYKIKFKEEKILIKNINEQQKIKNECSKSINKIIDIIELNDKKNKFEKKSNYYYIEQFISDRLEKTDNPNDKVGKTGVLQDFKLWFWYQQEQGSRNIPKDEKLYEVMNKKFGNCTRKGWVGVRFIPLDEHEDDFI